jgi:4-hydroxythreonine-4-phosphate dehydrogenase
VAAWKDGPAFYDLADRPERPEGPPGPSAAGGRSSVMYVKQAVALVRTGAAAAIATAPISKAALSLAGHGYPGHTELLADLCGLAPDEVAMLFVAPDLKVSPLTVHLPLAQAIAALSRDAVLGRLRLLSAEHARWFGAAPRIAVSALNPHAGEGGLFGREEREILAPAVEAARAAGIEASGPHPADTVCVRAARGEFDVVLALYHDQATIAVKARSFGRSVNVTLGLPFIRTSVDHGTAWDLAGRGLADHGSLVEAIALAAGLAGR